jgi:hypothetical protein
MNGEIRGNLTAFTPDILVTCVASLQYVCSARASPSHARFPLDPRAAADVLNAGHRASGVSLDGGLFALRCDTRDHAHALPHRRRIQALNDSVGTVCGKHR